MHLTGTSMCEFIAADEVAGWPASLPCTSQPQLAHLFPCHITLDAEGRVQQIGPLLQRFFNEQMPVHGCHVSKLFQVLTPSGFANWDFAQLASSSSPCMLKSLPNKEGTALKLQGSWISSQMPFAWQEQQQQPEPKCWIFLGQLFAEGLDDLAAAGVQLSDLSPFGLSAEYCLLYEQYKEDMAGLSRQLAMLEEKLQGLQQKENTSRFPPRPRGYSDAASHTSKHPPRTQKSFEESSGEVRAHRSHPDLPLDDERMTARQRLDMRMFFSNTSQRIRASNVALAFSSHGGRSGVSSGRKHDSEVEQSLVEMLLGRHEVPSQFPTSRIEIEEDSLAKDLLPAAVTGQEELHGLIAETQSSWGLARPRLSTINSLPSFGHSGFRAFNTAGSSTLGLQHRPSLDVGSGCSHVLTPASTVLEHGHSLPRSTGRAVRQRSTLAESHVQLAMPAETRRTPPSPKADGTRGSLQSSQQQVPTQALPLEVLAGSGHMSIKGIGKGRHVAAEQLASQPPARKTKSASKWFSCFKGMLPLRFKVTSLDGQAPKLPSAELPSCIATTAVAQSSPERTPQERLGKATAATTATPGCEAQQLATAATTAATAVVASKRLSGTATLSSSSSSLDVPEEAGAVRSGVLQVAVSLGSEAAMPAAPPPPAAAAAMTLPPLPESATAAAAAAAAMTLPPLPESAAAAAAAAKPQGISVDPARNLKSQLQHSARSDEQAGTQLEAVMAVLKCPAEKVMQVLANIDAWAFDSFELAEVTNNRPLSTLAFALFNRSGITACLRLDETKLARFLICIEDGYRDNPYHSRTHAADVLRTLYAITTRGGLIHIMSNSSRNRNQPQEQLSFERSNSQAALPSSSAGPSPLRKDSWIEETGGSSFQRHHSLSKHDGLTLLAVYLSAIIHDYDHRGLTNAFLIQDEDPLALLYNDTSPMENHHVAAAFAILHQPANNFMSHLSRQVRDVMRSHVIQMVLGTDMKQHFGTCGQFNTKMAAVKGASPQVMAPENVPLPSPRQSASGVVLAQTPGVEGWNKMASLQCSENEQAPAGHTLGSIPRSMEQASAPGQNPYLVRRHSALTASRLSAACRNGDAPTPASAACDSAPAPIQHPGIAGTAATGAVPLAFSPASAPVISLKHQSACHSSSAVNAVSRASSIRVRTTRLADVHIDDELNMLVWKMALKCADLGHLASVEHVHRKWVQLLEEEMFRQGDLEKARGYPVSPLMDRSRTGITTSQPGFFNVIVLPLFTSFANAVPAIEPLLRQVMKNHAMWVEEAALVVEDL